MRTLKEIFGIVLAVIGLNICVTHFFVYPLDGFILALGAVASVFGAVIIYEES